MSKLSGPICCPVGGSTMTSGLRDSSPVRKGKNALVLEAK